MGVPSLHPFDFGIFHSKPSILIHFGDPFMETPIVSVTGLRPPSPGGRGDQRPVGWQEWRATFGWSCGRRGSPRWSIRRGQQQMQKWIETGDIPSGKLT